MGEQQKMDEQQKELKTVSITDLWEIFVSRLWLMVIAAVVVMGGMWLYITLTFVPQYKSTATLYILKQENESSSSTSTTTASTSDFSLALNVVNDCTFLLKSHKVLDKVIEDEELRALGISLGYNDLYYSVSTSNPTGTRILEVTVKSDTSEHARRIVNRICDIGVAAITEAMGFKQVNFFEEGTTNEAPCNRTSITKYLLAGVIAAVVVYAIFLAVFLLDDRFQSDEDIEHTLGLTILGNIPNADEQKKGGKYGKYGRYYGKYGKYGGYGYGYGHHSSKDGEKAADKAE